jgi:hypothetical protein
MPAAQTCELTAGCLRLSFTWERDRFRHALSLVDRSRDGTPGTLLITSLEGEPDELWPASPVLQELHVESRSDERTVALLVGRAGRSHWSLSVLADSRRHELEFEAACRCVGQPTWLGSAYLAAGGVAAVESKNCKVGTDCTEATPVSLSRGDAQVWLQPASGDRYWRLKPGEGSPVMAPDSGFDCPRLAIAADWTGDDLRRTIQWSYRVAMRPESD